MCSALKALALRENLTRATLEKVVSLLARRHRQERNALEALDQLGPQASEFSSRLLQTLAAQLDRAGCTFDCCGYAAFYAPVWDYIQAILAVEPNREPSGSGTEGLSQAE